MQVDKNDIICGYPAPKVRDFLRKLRHRKYGAIVACKKAFGVSEKQAPKLLESLCKEGYIRKIENGWDTTVKGNALSVVRFVPRLSYYEMEEKLIDLYHRIQTVNYSDVFILCIAEARLFGSLMYKGRDSYGDIDIAIDLAPKFTDPIQYEQAKKKLIDDALNRGVKIPNEKELDEYPAKVIFDFLQARSPYISVHSMSELAKLQCLSVRLNLSPISLFNS